MTTLEDATQTENRQDRSPRPASQRSHAKITPVRLCASGTFRDVSIDWRCLREAKNCLDYAFNRWGDFQLVLVTLKTCGLAQDQNNLSRTFTVTYFCF